MKLTFYGGAGAVTGANYLLERNGEKILVDCGMAQGAKCCEDKNFEPFPYSASEITAVFITHAHIDHTGMLPKLYKEGFRGKVYSTPPTKDFSRLLLEDSLGILGKEAERTGREKIYEERDAEGVIKLWETVPYHQPVAVGPFTAEFINAGHILGSASIIINDGETKTVFSGDLGNTEPSLIKPTEYPTEVDYALIESVYGDRQHERVEKRSQLVEDFIEKIIRRGGTLLVPAFSMERTQMLLYELNEMTENLRIPRAPIYLDSPLAIKLTEVYARYKDYYRKEIREQIMRGDDIFDFPSLLMTLTSQESKEINRDERAKIIIAGAGMSHGGRIQHHEKKYLGDKKSGILFIGYQGEGSLGRRILEGEKRVRIYGEEVEVNCEVKQVTGYSAHADQADLLRWAEKLGEVKKIFVTQGEPEAEEALGKLIREKLGRQVMVPKPGERVVL